MSALIPIPEFSSEVHSSVGAAAKWAFEHVDPEEFPIWNHLPREPRIWFERFSEYLMLQPHDRGVLKICNRRRLQDGLPAIAMLPHDWRLHSVAWRWKDRVAAFDLFREAEEKRDMERRKRESKKRRISILSSLDDKIVAGLEAFNPGEDAFRLSELVGAIKTLGQEARAEFDDGPTKKSEIKITTMADLLRDAEREEFGDPNIIDGEWR